MKTETPVQSFAINDRVAFQPPYGFGMVGTVLKVRQVPAYQVCYVQWDGGLRLWESAVDLALAPADA